VKTGAGKFAPLLRRALACASAKIPMPCLRAGPASFSLISAEAFLLSGECGYHKLSLRGGTTWQSRNVQSGLTSGTFAVARVIN
jgi:hypothetical protein